jgi:hypothetical protein
LKVEKSQMVEVPVLSVFFAVPALNALVETRRIALVGTSMAAALNAAAEENLNLNPLLGISISHSPSQGRGYGA